MLCASFLQVHPLTKSSSHTITGHDPADWGTPHHWERWSVGRDASQAGCTRGPDPSCRPGRQPAGLPGTAPLFRIFMAAGRVYEGRYVTARAIELGS